ncbi:MAG: hypothetical protein H0W64_06935 [Gammaproteobacteria bacterium]|nr:hypothetical protein [Gammaproteobacteria bacterium]
MKMPILLEKMMFGFVESQILFVCDELKLFDDLITEGPATLEQLSQRMGLPLSSLERLLIGAHCIKLLEKEGPYYNVNAIWIPFLSRSSDHYCGGKFTHYFKTSYKIFDFLLPAVKTNQPQWEKIGKEAITQSNLDAVYIDHIYENEQSTTDFLSTMWASGYNDSVDLCHQFTFKGCKKLVDLGGANGSFAIAALHKNPDLTAVIMDYPHVRNAAEKKLTEHHCQSRGTFYPGNIFTDSLPLGDVYSIGYLLSDWPESRCVSLLQKVYDHLPPNGIIVILEKFFEDDKSGPYLTAMLNITMLLEMHGTHRSATEYGIWLQNIGFQHIQVTYSAGEKHMITAIK